MGNYTITDTYLKDFANIKIKNFLDKLLSDPGFIAMGEFSVGDGAGGKYPKILAGGGKLTTAGAVQQQFKTYAAGLYKQLQDFEQTMTKLSTDLLTIDSVLQNGEDASNITASELMTDLQDVLPTSSHTPPGP